MVQTALLWLNPFRNDKQNKIATSWRTWRNSCILNYLILSNKSSKTNNLYSEPLQYRNGTSNCRHGLELVQFWNQVFSVVQYEEDAMSMSGLKDEQMSLQDAGVHQALLLTILLRKSNEAHEGNRQCLQRSYQLLVVILKCFLCLFVNKWTTTHLADILFSKIVVQKTKARQETKGRKKNPAR